MTALRGSRMFTRGDRLCDLVSQLFLYLDMQWVAFDAMSQRPPPRGPATAGLVSAVFGIRIFYPIYSRFKNSFNPALAAPVEITIVDGAMPPDLEEYKSDEMGGTSLMIWNMALVFFYEQQLDGMRAKFGKRTDNWPEIARFAWALRNAAAHNGALHFTSPDVRPVHWHHLRYDARDNGTKVIGKIMQPGDVLIFLIEFSDELDRLGLPPPA
jgi:hypothetical protein